MTWSHLHPTPITEADHATVLKQLNSDSVEERLTALNRVIASHAPCDSSELADFILKLVQTDAKPEVREMAILALANSFKSFLSRPAFAKALFAAVDDDCRQVRLYAACSLGRLQDSDNYVPDFLRALRHDDADIRTCVMQSLHDGPFDTAITQEIIAAASDSQPEVRRMAVNALVNISERSEEQRKLARPVVMAALKDPEPSISYLVAKALRANGETNIEVDTVFKEYIYAELSSNDQNRRTAGMGELSRAPQGAEIFIDRLIALLDGNNSDAHFAMPVLAKIGAGAEAAIPRLKQLAMTESHVPQAAKALAALGVHDPEILQWLQQKCFKTGLLYQAAQGLMAFGKEGVPYLIEGLNWDNKGQGHHPLTVQNCCVEALGGIGKDASAAIPYLLEIIDKGGGQPIRPTCGGEPYSNVLEALVKIGAENESVVSRVSAIGADEHDSRRSCAIKALKIIGAG